MARAEARVEQYWNGDGLHEIAAGVLFGLTAVWVCVPVFPVCRVR